MSSQLMSHQLDALVGQMGSSALSVEVQELEQLREQCDLIWVHEHLQVPSSTSALLYQRRTLLYQCALLYQDSAANNQLIERVSQSLS